MISIFYLLASLSSKDLSEGEIQELQELLADKGTLCGCRLFFDVVPKGCKKSQDSKDQVWFIEKGNKYSLPPKGYQKTKSIILALSPAKIDYDPLKI